MSEHAIVPLRLYVRIFLALVALTVLTVGVAYVDLGVFNDVVKLSIAIAKAILVVLYFMHLRWSPSLQWIAAAAGIAWLVVLFAFTLGDYLTRAPLEPM